MGREPSERLAYIDTWRVIGAALVIGAHLALNHRLSAAISDTPLELATKYGETGVFIFFFISGFVVSRTCLAHLENGGYFSIGAFYLRRAFRIIPPLALYVSACSVLSLFGVIRFSPQDFLGAATYLCNSSLLDCGWSAGHTWSLAFEEQFYVCFPLLFSAFITKRIPKLLFPALAFAAVPLLFSVNWIGRTGFIVIYALFFAGFLAAKYPILGTVVGRSRFSAALLVFSAVVVFCPVWATNSFLMGKYYKFLLIPAVPAMVLSSASFMRGSSRIGKATYSIYLWQQLFTGEPFSGWSPYFEILLLVGAFGGCLVIFELVERPLIGLGRELSAIWAARNYRRQSPTQPAPL